MCGSIHGNSLMKNCSQSTSSLQPTNSCQTDMFPCCERVCRLHGHGAIQCSVRGGPGEKFRPARSIVQAFHTHKGALQQRKYTATTTESTTEASGAQHSSREMAPAHREGAAARLGEHPGDQARGEEMETTRQEVEGEELDQCLPLGRPRGGGGRRMGRHGTRPVTGA